MTSKIPLDDPPPYAPSGSQSQSQYQSQSQSSNSGATSSSSSSSYLHPHRARNGIPPAARRSMEDEGRPLPPGWIRQYNGEHGHQFFVDTRATPPRSIWHHPYDDDQYLDSLTTSERERVQHLHKIPNLADVAAESSDDDGALPDRPEHLGGAQKFGRKLKDKITNSNHVDREAQRQRRAEEERIAYEQHQQFRNAMRQAELTGEPQYLGRDNQGKDVYIEPPGGVQPGYSLSGRTVNPYSQGPYANPNARFISPPMAYQRPLYGGYGGGLGYPMMGMGMMGFGMGGMI